VFSNIKSPYFWLLTLAFGFGAALRFYALSHGFSFHPDERHIVMVAEKLSWKDMNPHFFAYGSFPFYLLWAVSNCLSPFWPELARYDGLFIVGRSISVVFGLFGAYLTYRLAIKITEDKLLASIAAIFLLFNVFHIQLSRFYAFDGVLTTLCIATLLGISYLTNPNSSWKPFFITGLTLGLAIATKISALSLGIPIGVAVIYRLYQEKRFFTFKVFFYCLLLATSTLTFFTLAEPYAWLDWQTFIANNKEQISMVKGEWRPPYTIQYANTTPYLYHLEQMFKYTIGWPIGVLATIGIISYLSRLLKKINPTELLVFIWIVAVFLVIARYQVKFPRYLLPIYPVLMIFAALGLQAVAQVIQRLFPIIKHHWVVLGAITVAGLHAIAFVSIYSTEHTYYKASRWIFERIPAGSRILQGHWDDTLPLHLPGFSPSRYKFEGKESELPLYEPDNPAKLKIVSERTANADYIILPTPRLVGSIPRIPTELPQATTYLQLLFSGNLGFQLVQSFKINPSIGAFTLNDELADESFSVYDHPKVWIFKNISKLSSAEIQERIESPLRFAPLPTREQMLLKNSHAQLNTYKPTEKNSFPSIIFWIIAIQCLALLSLPLVSLACQRFPDHGYALSKSAGIFIFGFFAWILPALGLANFNSSYLWTILILLIVANFFLVFKIFESNLKILPQKKYIITTEILFSSVFLVFLLIRAFNPEIFWGEKPMDLTFLNYFLRSETLPPQDPWAAGNTMRYYYLGTYIIAALLKLTSIPAHFGYNLAIAILPALCVSSFYSALLYLLRKNRLAIIASLSLVLISNFEIIRLVFSEKSKIGFDTFWASTRFFASGNFTEYPIWSFLFADLHAHVISLVFVALLVALAIELVKPSLQYNSISFWAHRVLYSSLLGTLTAFNTWDFIVYSALTGFLIFARPIRTSFLQHSSKIIKDLIIIGFVSFAAAAPYLFSTQPAENASWGWAHYFEYNSLRPILLHFGLSIGIIILAFIFLLIRKSKKTISISTLGLMVSIILAMIPIALGVASHVHLNNVGTPPWSVLILCSGIIVVSILGINIADKQSLSARFGFACSALVGMIMPLTEIFFLIDKMNTIFKFYLSLWFLLGISACSLLLFIFSQLNKKMFSLESRLLSNLIQISVICVAATAWIGSFINIWSTVTFQRIEGPRPTLDGLAYLQKKSYDEASLVTWMNTHIKGVPHILEAQGDAYREFTRIAMYTGLPTVLGWEHHTKQRGTPEREIKRRKMDIFNIYSSPDVEFVDSLLEQYSVDLVVIGDIERQQYPEMGLEKFFTNPHKFITLFKSGDTYLIGRTKSLEASSGESRYTLTWHE
jgi:YYY domain-containing protein